VEEAGLRLEEAGAAIVEGVERSLAGWVEREVRRIADAWGGLDPTDRRRLDDAARQAGALAVRRVGGALRALLATDPRRQTSTPLEIVRGAYREPTAVLAAAGVPAVVRDSFDERAWPDDRYGLVPRSLGDLGDPELGPLHLAWGLAKAAVVRDAPPS
jgi:hypothetical protein